MHGELTHREPPPNRRASTDAREARVVVAHKACSAEWSHQAIPFRRRVEQPREHIPECAHCFARFIFAWVDMDVFRLIAKAHNRFITCLQVFVTQVVFPGLLYAGLVTPRAIQMRSAPDLATLRISISVHFGVRWHPRSILTATVDGQNLASFFRTHSTCMNPSVAAPLHTRI